YIRGPPSRLASDLAHQRVLELLARPDQARSDGRLCDFELGRDLVIAAAERMELVDLAELGADGPQRGVDLLIGDVAPRGRRARLRRGELEVVDRLGLRGAPGLAAAIDEQVVEDRDHPAA